jgi:AraC-like DNA-binding protein
MLVVRVRFLTRHATWEGTIDPLSDVGSELKLRGTVPRLSTFGETWAVSVPSGCKCLHLILRGRCELARADGHDPIRLGAGDLVVVASGQPHLLRSQTASHPAPLPMERAGHEAAAFGTGSAGFGSETTEIASARFDLDERVVHLADRSLPPLIRIQGGQIPVPLSFGTVLDCFRTELSYPGPGRDIILTRLCEILVIQALRVHLLEMDGRERGLLRVLVDPVVGSSLDGFHSSPAGAWSVAKLAGGAHRSRRRFSARFSTLAAVPVRAFVRRSRVHRAVALLRAGHHSLLAVAQASGFRTVSALCRAFRRETGVTPAAYWRSVQQRPFPRPGTPIIQTDS